MDNIQKRSKRIYTPEQIRFITKKIHGRSYKDMMRLFNEHFDLAITYGQMASLLKNHKLSNGFGHGNPTIPPKRKYLDVHIKFLRKNVTGSSLVDLTKIFNEKFGFTVTPEQLHSLLGRYNLRNGRDCRIKPGNIPFNKGRKGFYAPGSEKGWFKKGNIPWDYKPVGSERINVDGYVEIKVSDTVMPKQRRWRAKHVVVWEKANGPVPKSHVILFIDSDKANIKLSNLLLVSRKELAVLNHLRMISNNGDITKANVGIARIKVLIADRKRGTLKSLNKKDFVIIDNRGQRIFVAQEGKSKRFISVRKIKTGLRRLRADLKSRKTIDEARKDLLAYALKRGWHRV